MAREINNFLDRFEDTRETRFEPEQGLRQYKGFRSEWTAYVDDNYDNLYSA